MYLQFNAFGTGLNRLSVPLAVSALVFMLSACSVTPERAQEQASQTTVKVAEKGAASSGLGELSEGELVTFSAGPLAGKGRVVSGPQYHAASGRVCKRFHEPDKKEVLSVACKGDDGRWYWVKPLETSERQRPMDASAGLQRSERIVATTPPIPSKPTELEHADWQSETSLQKAQSSESASVEEHITSQTYTLEPDETLWSFSRRVTGTGLHWEAIAEHNALEDSSNVQAGTQLSVPDTLIRASAR